MFKNIKNFGIILFFFSPLLAIAQGLKFEKKPDGILLVENDAPRYFYRTSELDIVNPFTRTNYIHPLYGLNGEVLTEDFPDDHPHHHGIFWAWHQLYVEGARIADPWMNEGVEWDVLKTNTNAIGKTATLSSETVWRNKSNSEAVIKENLIITFQRIDEDIFSLNFSIKLTALVDGVAIGGSEDPKGYGGFSSRLRLPKEVGFTSLNGVVEPEDLPVQAGPWMNLSGNFDSSSNEASGIVIMGEPEKLPSYQGWILRSANSMQNMAFPGRTRLRIEKQKPLVFRNQLLIHRKLSSREINTFYREFQKSDASE